MRTNNTKKYNIFYEYRKVPNTEHGWIKKTTVHRVTHNANDTMTISEPIKTTYCNMIVSFEHGSALVPVHTDEKGMTEIEFIKPDTKGPIRSSLFNNLYKKEKEKENAEETN